MLLALQQATEPPFFSITAPDDVLGAWLICFFTLAVFSFLYKDNPFYKVAEHVFVGVGTAFYTLQYYEEGVIGRLYEHMEQAGRALGEGGSGVMDLGGTPVPAAWAIGLRSVAVLLSLMLLVRLFRSGSWAPRWAVATMVGIYAAIKMTGETQSKLVLQVEGLMRKPLVNPELASWGSDWAAVEQTQVFYTFANLVLLVGVLCALLHFVFTFRRGKVLAGASRVGVVVLMLTFGAMFGFTVLGRYALLIDRIDTLGDYTGGAYSLAPPPAAGSAGALQLMLSPPVLLAVLIALVLAVAAASRKRSA